MYLKTYSRQVTRLHEQLCTFSVHQPCSLLTTNNLHKNKHHPQNGEIGSDPLQQSCAL